MKQKLTFFAVLMMAMALPKVAKAYDFSYTYQGKTLFYYITDNYQHSVEVVTPVGDGYYSYVSGDVVIPDSVEYNSTKYTVTSIGSCAFYDCTSLTSIIIPNSVTNIGLEAFHGCSSLTSVTIPNSVTSIGGFAFRDCSGLTSVTIPNSVIHIGSYAFYNCSGLTSVAIPNSVTSIGSYAFYNCSGLTSVTIPDSVTSIDNATFWGCSSLISITIPNSVTSIGSYAFYKCSGLTSVTIPNSVTSIAFGAFSRCTSLVSIVVDSGNTHYDSRDNCNAIIQTDLNLLVQGCNTTIIPNSVTAIGSYAFHGCSGLTSITIPNSVTGIGNYAFGSCHGLTSVYCKATVPPGCGGGSFDSCTYSIYYVPCSSVSAYQSANGWGYYSSWIQGTWYDPIYSYSIVSSNDTMGTVTTGIMDCDSNMTVTATPYTGYQFNGWSDGSTGTTRTVHLTSDTSITALFGRITYAIIGQPNNTARGVVTGSDTVYYGDSVTFTATPNYGYYFQRWNDYNTDNPRTVTATANVTYTAYFYPNSYSVVVHSSDSSQGTVSGSGNSNYLVNRTIHAYPATGYHFSHWSDGDSNATRIVSVTQDSVLTAYFEINSYQLTVLPNDTTLGAVTGSGIYTHGISVTITATATPGNRFDHWSDNTLLASYTVTLTSDMQLVAVFVPADTTYIHDTTYVDVFVHDTTYIDVHDTTYITVTDTVTNTVFDTVVNTVYDTLDNYIYDTTIVTDTLWLTQYDTVWVYDTLVIHDTVYVGQEGIGDVDALNAKVYSSQGQIVVEGADGNMVTLYDVTGRVLATRRDEYAPLRFDAPASGAYMLKIGNLPARKVVLIR